MRHGGDRAVRLSAEFGERRFSNVLTGAAVDGPVLRLADALALFPVAVLAG